MVFTTWNCHIHTGSNCCFRRDSDTQMYYHVILKVGQVCPEIQRTFNKSTVVDEFWEEIGLEPYLTAISNASLKDQTDVIINLYAELEILDKNHYKYQKKFNRPADFAKEHFISTGYSSHIKLVNKHLMTKVRSKNPQIYYTKPSWFKSFVQQLFPLIKGRVATNTPDWLIKLIGNERRRIKPRKPSSAR